MAVARMKFMIHPPFRYHSITVFMSVGLPAGWLRLVSRRARCRRGVRRPPLHRSGKAGAVPGAPSVDAPPGGVAAGGVGRGGAPTPGAVVPGERVNGRLGRGGSGGSGVAAPAL